MYQLYKKVCRGLLSWASEPAGLVGALTKLFMFMGESHLSLSLSLLLIFFFLFLIAQMLSKFA